MSYTPYIIVGPGEFLEEELEYRGWSQVDFSEITGLTEKTISKIMNNKQSITIETAQLFSRIFGQSPQYWVNLDTNYRLRISGKTYSGSEIETKADIYRHMPIKELQRRGWIHTTKTTQELIREVKIFWGVPHIDFSFLENQSLPNFRKSESYSNYNQYYALTWYRRARNIAENYHGKNYDKERLQILSKRIHVFSNKENGIKHFLDELTETGVKFFVLRHLQKTYTDGASFIINSNPVIVYTCRYDRVDNFWFTIAHEIGHILFHLNDKNLFFIDEEKSKQVTTTEEKKADAFASSVLKEKEIIDFYNRSRYRILKKSIVAGSSVLNINEGIIVGILQHHEMVPHTHLNRFKQSISDQIPSEYREE